MNKWALILIAALAGLYAWYSRQRQSTRLVRPYAEPYMNKNRRRVRFRLPAKETLDSRDDDARASEESEGDTQDVPFDHEEVKAIMSAVVASMSTSKRVSTELSKDLRDLHLISMDAVSKKVSGTAEVYGADVTVYDKNRNSTWKARVAVDVFGSQMRIRDFTPLGTAPAPGVQAFQAATEAGGEYAPFEPIIRF